MTRSAVNRLSLWMNGASGDVMTCSNRIDKGLRVVAVGGTCVEVSVLRWQLLPLRFPNERLYEVNVWMAAPCMSHLPYRCGFGVPDNIRDSLQERCDMRNTHCLSRMHSHRLSILLSRRHARHQSARRLTFKPVQLVYIAGPFLYRHCYLSGSNGKLERSAKDLG